MEDQQAYRLQVRLSGLHCNGCAMRVKSTLEELPEVLSATVSEGRDSCEVELRESPGDPQSLVSTIEALGFSASLDS